MKIFINIVQIKKSPDSEKNTFITHLAQKLSEVRETKYSLKEKLMSGTLELGQ